VGRRLESLRGHLVTTTMEGVAPSTQVEEAVHVSGPGGVPVVLTGNPGGLRATVTVEGKTVEVPIGVDAEGLRHTDAATLNKAGLGWLHDPGYVNTAPCTSRICFLDGPAGKLTYRGYPIEQLAAKSSFPETSFLLLFGELPTAGQLREFSGEVARHSAIPEGLVRMMSCFRHDAHPMGMLVSAIAAMSTFHPEANPALAGQGVYDDIGLRTKQVYRILGKMPTIAAALYRQRLGRPANMPRTDMGYAENFLYMMDTNAPGGAPKRPHPSLVRALDILFILHADHEQNCSTSAMRHLSSSGVDVYNAVAGAVSALYGPLHGGANEAVVRMLERIGSVDNVQAFVAGVKAGKEKLMGFGHRVYKNYDPRARIVRQLADEVFGLVGKDPLIEVATALERIALSDEYFVKRKLYPNVDFYSGLIYRAMGFPTELFPVLFAIPRTVGWLSHWWEYLDTPAEKKIARPRQVYVGETKRDYVDMPARQMAPSTAGKPPGVQHSQASKRAGLQVNYE